MRTMGKKGWQFLAVMVGFVWTTAAMGQTFNFTIQSVQAAVGTAETVTIYATYEDTNQDQGGVADLKLIINYDNSVFTSIDGFQTLNSTSAFNSTEMTFPSAGKLRIKLGDTTGDKTIPSGTVAEAICSFNVTVDAGAAAGNYDFAWDLTAGQTEVQTEAGNYLTGAVNYTKGVFTVLKYFNAIADNLNVAEDDAATQVNVLDNDVDENGTIVDNATVTAVGAASHGTVILNGGIVTYEPADDYVGADSFTYTAKDTDDNEDTGTVTVAVTAVNDPPVFTKGADVTVTEDSGAYNQAFATGIGKGGGVDESTQVLSFNVTNNTNTALFSAAPEIDPATGNLSFTPAADANGSADITVTLSDNGGGDDTSVAQTFTITITAVNDEPSFMAGGNLSGITEDAGARTVTAWATNISKGGPQDPSYETGQTLTFTLTVTDFVPDNAPGFDSTNCFAVAPAISPSTGDLTFTFAANASGVATIQVVLTDDGGTANGGDDTAATETFTISVDSVNDAPVLTGTPSATPSYVPATQTNEMPSTFTVTVDVTAVTDSDVDGDGLTPAYKWYVVNQDDSVDFLKEGLTFIYPDDDPNSKIDLYDQLKFTYTTTDGVLTSNELSVMVAIGNQPPELTWSIDPVDPQEGDLITITVNANDADHLPSADNVTSMTITVDSVDVTGNATVTTDGVTGELVYTIQTDQDTSTHAENKEYEVSVTAKDASNSQVTQTRTVTVTDVNSVPAISGTPVTSVNQDAHYSFIPTLADDDAEDGAGETNNTFTATMDGMMLPEWLTIDAATGELSSIADRPDNGDVGGSYTNIVISFTDGANETVSLPAFDITVNNVNDAPVAVADEDDTTEDASVGIDVLANDTDIDITGQFENANVDGDQLSVSGIVMPPTLGSVTNNGTNVTFDPGEDFQYLDDGENEVVTFTYTVSDGNGGISNAATVTVTVNGANDAPVAEAISTYVKANKADVMEKESVTFTLSATDADTADQGLLVYTLDDSSLTPNQGVLVDNNPEFTFTPADGFRGLVELSYKASDGTVDSPDETIKITVGTPQWYPYIDIASYDDNFDGTGFYKAVIRYPAADTALLSMQVKNKDAFEPIDYINNGSTGLLPGTYALTVSVFDATNQTFDLLDENMPVDLVVENYGDPVVADVSNPPEVENGSYVLAFDVENSSGYELELETPSGKVVTYGQTFRPNADGIITPDQTVTHKLTLTETGEYTWTAIAVNPVGTDEEISTFTIEEAAAPADAPDQVDNDTMTPVGVAGTAADDGTLPVLFNWEASAGAASYLLQVEKGSQIVLNMRKVPDGDTAYGPVQLAPGSYRWAVIAQNGVDPDNEAWSNWVSFTVQASAEDTTPMIDAVSVVGAPIAADATQLQFNITWDVAGTAISLWLVSGTDGSRFSGQFPVDASGTTVTIDEADFGTFDFNAGGTDYYYQISGIAEDGTEGDATEMATYSVQDAAILAGDPQKPVVGVITGSVIPVTAANATQLKLVSAYSMFYNSATYASGIPVLQITNTGDGTFDATIPATYAKEGMYLYLMFVGSNDDGVKSPHSDWKMYQYTGGAWGAL